MSGILMAVMGAGGATFLIKSDLYNDMGVFGVDSSAGVTFRVNSDGTVLVDGDVMGTFDTYNWIDPTTGSSAYYVRATTTSGSFTSGTTGTWLALNTNRTWVLRTTTLGFASVTATFQVATDAAGTNVVASGSVTLSSELS